MGVLKTLAPMLAEFKTFPIKFVMENKINQVYVLPFLSKEYEKEFRSPVFQDLLKQLRHKPTQEQMDNYKRFLKYKRQIGRKCRKNDMNGILECKEFF